MTVLNYTATGTKSTAPLKLPANIFDVEVKNHKLLKDAYVAYLANGRQNSAKTLTRGDVSGGGIKPWRQKGTGRARFGSSRNPIWRGGGVAFGPTGIENYSHKLNVKAKHKALCQALSLAVQSENLIIIETFKTDGKVKDTVSLLEKLGAKRNVLIVVSILNDLVKRATNNLPDVKAMYVKNLTVFDVMNADKIILSKKSVAIIKSWLGDK
jgi:large subunit ribosomal protein L4